uniref:GH08880p n=1 Tax=Drosophila melanogaster TaxID=7227 RepID=Q8SZU7_DROME|nr:GH08880p [Drosophila melanogaster]
MPCAMLHSCSGLSTAVQRSPSLKLPSVTSVAIVGTIWSSPSFTKQLRAASSKATSSSSTWYMRCRMSCFQVVLFSCASEKLSSKISSPWQVWRPLLTIVWAALQRLACCAGARYAWHSPSPVRNVMPRELESLVVSSRVFMITLVSLFSKISSLNCTSIDICSLSLFCRLIFCLETQLPFTASVM